MKKRVLTLSLTLGLILGLVYQAKGEVQHIQVKSNQVINHVIKLSPGLPTLIEFPEEIVSDILGDSTLFECKKVPPSNKKIVCKAKTIEKFSTRLIVTTESNEFILLLTIDDFKAHNPEKYSFINPDIIQEVEKDPDTDVNHPGSQDLLHPLLYDFTYQFCKNRHSSSVLDIQCIDTMSLGTQNFLRFKLKSKSRSPLHILNCSIAVQTLGGITGLAIKEESPINTNYLIQNQNLHFGEETVGVVEIPSLQTKTGQRIVLNIQTDKGEGILMIIRRN